MTVLIKENYPTFKIAQVNGRQVILHRIDEISLDRPGFYSGTANEAKFEIFGGKHAGGSSREWFVQWDALGDFHMDATSLTDAINLIEAS